MASNLDMFKEFVKRHPLLKQEVISKRKTWQEIYEDWVILKDDSMWDTYKTDTFKNEDVKSEKKVVEEKKESSDDVLKTMMQYAKKINPDTITKYVSSIQKVLELVAAFGGGSLASKASSKTTSDPLFERKFDEWY